MTAELYEILFDRISETLRYNFAAGTLDVDSLADSITYVIAECLPEETG